MMQIVRLAFNPPDKAHLEKIENLLPSKIHTYWTQLQEWHNLETLTVAVSGFIKFIGLQDKREDGE